MYPPDYGHNWFTSATGDDTEGTHACLVCDHATTIETPHIRTRHFCTECEDWREFKHVAYLDE